MRAGEFRERVTIETRATSSTPLGGVDEQWQPLAEVWAGVAFRFSPGQSTAEKRATAHGGEIYVQQLEIKIRYLSNVDAACRVVWKGVPYNVRAVIGSQAERQLILICVSGGGDGR